jgi:hypothetical protein
MKQNDGPYYLVAGSNQEPPIGVDIVSVDSPGQSTLDREAGGSTQVGDATPFKHFPVSQGNLRNPLAVWDQKY